MISLSLHRLKAWSPALVDLPIGKGEYSYTNSEKFLIEQIPSAAARRLSQLTKMSVDLGLQVSGNNKVDHIVFSSRHGELANATELLNLIAKGEILSPTLFSQSVHNTAVGTLTLLQKNHAAATSLAAGANSFLLGLISCASFLNENPEKQVLFVAADQSVPSVFENLAEENLPFAIAALISRQNSGISLQIEGPHRAANSPEKLPQGIRFLRWFFSEERTLKINGDDLCWEIRKC